MKPPVLTHWSVRRVRAHLRAKRFAVPKLQRNFVWNASNAATLMDSVFKEMPIGSLFLWEMHRKFANLIRQSANVLPPFDGANTKIWFVIDGQQRLSVLHQAFVGQVRENDAGREIDFSRLCFVVRPPKDQENPPRVVYRKTADKQHVPIHDILSADWRRRMPVRSKAFLKRIGACRSRLLGYPVPIVLVQSATIEEIAEVFIRLNSRGMRITSADRAIALMGKLDVRAMAQELRDAFRHERFYLGSIDPILMGFNLITETPKIDGDPPKLDVMARRWSKRIEQSAVEQSHFRDLWNKYKKAFLAAADYLRHKFPIHDDTFLPSANMLATLAVFFFEHPGQPDRHQAREVRKWFWATGVAQRYSGRGYHRNIVADAKFFKTIASGKKKTFTFRDRVDPVFAIQGSEYSSRSARSRAFFCLLATQKPRYVDNGEEIPLGRVMSHSNRRNRHHIFPRAQLRNHFAANAYNSLVNICFLVARDNAKIGMKLPRKYLSEYREEGRARFRRVMKSHLIPAAGENAVWLSGTVAAFKQFRKERLELIVRAYEKQAGTKLFIR